MFHFIFVAIARITLMTDKALSKYLCVTFDSILQ